MIKALNDDVKYSLYTNKLLWPHLILPTQSAFEDKIASYQGAPRDSLQNLVHLPSS